MKWFDTKELKNEKSLTKEQVRYIKKQSFSVFVPLNVLFRGHWDFMITNVAVNTLADHVSGLSAFLLLVTILCLICFEVVHSRRLSWNRKDWKDFNEFEDSETSHEPWGIIFFIGSLLWGIFF